MFTLRQATSQACRKNMQLCQKLTFQPVFHVQCNYTLTKPSSLVWYALLGPLAVIVSVALTDSILDLRAWF
jgi:hypothetical protein